MRYTNPRLRLLYYTVVYPRRQTYISSVSRALSLRVMPKNRLGFRGQSLKFESNEYVALCVTYRSSEQGGD